jgi:hypothetical protein
MVVDMKVLSCIVTTWVVHPCKLVVLIIHPCMVVFLFFHPCTMIEKMDLLNIDLELMVPQGIAVFLMDLSYTMFEGFFVLESWGLQTDKENFLVKECFSNWFDPIKD